MKLRTYALTLGLLPFAFALGCDKKEEPAPAPAQEAPAAEESMPADPTPEAATAEGGEVKAPEAKETKAAE